MQVVRSEGTAGSTIVAVSGVTIPMHGQSLGDVPSGILQRHSYPIQEGFALLAGRMQALVGAPSDGTQTLSDGTETISQRRDGGGIGAVELGIGIPQISA